MSTPVASGTLYASVADLRNVMSGTDSGTGTAAQLTDDQLTLALYAASNSVFGVSPEMCSTSRRLRPSRHRYCTT